MGALTVTEGKYIRDFFSASMQEAAKKFSGFSGFEISVKSIECQLSDAAQPFCLEGENGLRMLIETPLLGSLTGRSFLVLRTLEADLITSKLNGALLKEAMLKELDNILSATVITHLSNKLEMEVYGDVPVARIVQLESADAMIAKFSPNGAISFVCKTVFSSGSHRDFLPVFVWKFGHKIVNAILESVAAHQKV